MSLLGDNFFVWTKFASILLLFGPLLTGCANPGPPQPPSLRLPEVVSDLSAERIGSLVKLRWTTPDKTTDGISITGPVTAEICRYAISTAIPSACSFTLRIPAKPGPSETSEVLSPALRTDPQSLLTYRISILNSKQRSAGFSSPAFAAAGSAPPVIRGFRVRATEEGAMLQWKPEDAADSIELDRLHVVAAVATPRKPRSFQPVSREPAEMRFRAANTAAGGPFFGIDAGGSVDATAHHGETYTYTAQRIRRTVLSGHALEIRSDLSPAITIAMRDSFPPKAPTGLEIILAGQGEASPSVDLSWRPNTEPDLTGYFVYRQELEPDGTVHGAPLRLTATPILEPGFRDTTPLAGHRYDYFLTAVDNSGNESVRGLAVRQDVPFPR